MDSVFINGTEYSEVWLNGVKISDFDGGTSGGDTGGEEEIVYPYSDADCVITYRKTNSGTTTKTFTVIDSSLPYSINGSVGVKKLAFSYGETQVKLVNLKPTIDTSTTFFPTKIEQLRLPNLTDLSYLFTYFGYNSSYAFSWSPQYFEFSDNAITNTNYMFAYCRYLTDDMWNEIVPILLSLDMSGCLYFNSMFYTTHGVAKNIVSDKPSALNLSSLDTSSATTFYRLFYGSTYLGRVDVTGWNTSNVTNMYGTFCGCRFYDSIIGVRNWDVTKVTDMTYCFYGDTYLKSLDLSGWRTDALTNVTQMFTNCTNLKVLDLRNFNTSKVTTSTTTSMFSGVSDCTIFIGTNWTLGTSATLGGGTNLKFVQVEDVIM